MPGVCCGAGSAFNAIPNNETGGMSEELLRQLCEMHNKTGSCQFGTLIQVMNRDPNLYYQFKGVHPRIGKPISFLCAFDLYLNAGSGVFVIIYQTLHQTTHAITWDCNHGLILDSNGDEVDGFLEPIEVKNVHCLDRVLSNLMVFKDSKAVLKIYECRRKIRSHMK